MVHKYGWSHDDYLMADYLVDEVSPYTLHHTMFATTIREQASDVQKSYWMPKIDGWEIIGCYAQTELGHGSNVRGIECQARYEPKTREFVLHSPTLTASKVGYVTNNMRLILTMMWSGGMDQWEKQRPTQ